MKTKGLNEAHFLSLLQRALSRTTPDAQLATTIYAEVEREARLTKDLESFEKFCEKGALPNLAPERVAELQSELTAKFGEGNVTLTPDENEKSVAVEIGLPDRTVTNRVKVQAEGADASEGDSEAGFCAVSGFVAGRSRIGLGAGSAGRPSAGGSYTSACFNPGGILGNKEWTEIVAGRARTQFCGVCRPCPGAPNNFIGSPKQIAGHASDYLATCVPILENGT
jgi:hypothetical protein